MGTEIRTFTTLKEISEFTLGQAAQYRVLYEDYSQWLGSLLRTCEENHKNEAWYQKSTISQKNIQGQKKPQNAKTAPKKSGEKGKNSLAEPWIESGSVLLASTEQGHVEILFEAIEKINEKLIDLEKFKATIQQLERIGMGKNVNYVIYFEEDIPKKIVVRSKGNTPEDSAFKFATELSVPAVYKSFSN